MGNSVHLSSGRLKPARLHKDRSQNSQLYNGLTRNIRARSLECRRESAEDGVGLDRKREGPSSFPT
jgi:hypothetical protein